MKVSIDLNTTHHVVSASAHNYPEATAELSIDRTLIHHDIIFLIEGEWQFTEEIDGETNEFLLRPNDFLILQAGRHHYTKYPCTPGTRTFCIHITREQHDLDSSCKSNIQIGQHVHCPQNSKIIYYMKQAIDTFWSNKELSQQKADAYITLLFCELAAIENENRYSDDFSKILELFNSHPERNYSVEDIATYLHVSVKKVKDIFENEVGQKIHAFQVDRKLENIAIQLEVEPDIRLKELASTYGFYDEFYLSKAFKKKYGVSPAGYRKSLGEYSI